MIIRKMFVNGNSLIMLGTNRIIYFSSTFDINVETVNQQYALRYFSKNEQKLQTYNKRS